jgi:subtilisin-like proprotein convertase family protein
MHGFRTTSPWVLLLAVLAFGGTRAFPEEPGPLRVGEHLTDVLLESPHPYPVGSDGEMVWSEHFRSPGARYLVLDFRRLDLAPGDRLEIRDSGGKTQVYRGKGPQGKGRDFITKAIAGDEVHLRLYVGGSMQRRYGYRIERVSRGFSPEELADRYGAGETESICGTGDMEDVICYAGVFPNVYERSLPVALMLMDGVELCSAWLASCENHLITASHCTWDLGDFDSQAELDRMEFRFLYQEPVCGGAAATFEHSFLGGTWLENDHELDYTLVQAPPGEDPASTYGWLLIDNRLADIDELIYIVGHPGWGPKQISLYSTHPEDQDNPDGFCEVYSTNEPACVGGSVPEIGYYCDTQGGGNSGSPVLSRVTNKVVALNHCADCPNRGVRIQNIWAHNQAGPNPLPECSLFEEVGQVRLDAPAYGCTADVAVQVHDGSLRGAGSVTVELWSTTETGPESLSLAETTPSSGVFTSSIPLAPGSVSSGDGAVSVAHGDALTVRYVDADDGQGGVNILRQDTAAIDCIAPAISGLEVLDVLGVGATVRWQTDEAAGSEVWYGTSPPAWTVASELELVTEHELRIESLTPCTDYAFLARSADAVGNLAQDDNQGGYHWFSTGVDVQPRFDETRSYNIRDNRNVISTLTVTDDEAVVDVNVLVDITHVYDGDVEIYLMGPNGMEIELSTDNGADGDNYTDTLFDDEAASRIVDGIAPFTGSFQPEQLLATFDGISAAGDWSLRVFDDSDGDEGTLESWSLLLQYPARPCGPHAGYDSHWMNADQCAPGEPGDEDGVWDAGERVTFHVTLENNGTEPVTGLSAVAMSLTSGVVVLDSTAQFPDIPAGAAVTSQTPFTAVASSAMACGESIRLLMDIQANEGAWTATLEQILGVPSDGMATVLDEGFDAGIPGTWTVVDGGTSPDTWYADSADDPLGCTSAPPAAPIAGSWAAVDSDCAGAFDLDEALITPVLDLTGATGATVEFDHYYNRYETEVPDLDLRSSLTGGAWVNVRTWTNDTANPQHESIDITAQAAGATGVELRWRYHGANYDWYWFVDNIQVTSTAPPSCDMSVCGAAGAPPGEQTGARWLDVRTFTWDADAVATGGYILYRGASTDLVGLQDSATDSCRRLAGAATVADLSADHPEAPGGLAWFLVTAWNDAGEGSSGSGAGGPRVVNTSGVCPP